MRLAALCYTLLLSLYCAQAYAGPIHPQGNLALCLDVAGGSNANGTPLQIARCSGSPAQDFTIAGPQLKVLGKCVDVKGGNTQPMTQLQIWDCLPSPNQAFLVGFGMIQWVGKQQCLDVPFAKFADGTLVKTFPCNPGDKAQWWATGGTSAAPATAPVVAAPAPVSAPAGGRTYTMVNQCNQSVWVAIQQNGGMPALQPSGFELATGQSKSVASPKSWGGRIWGRTGCQVNGNAAKCESGDTGGLLQPNGIGGQPTSLAEWTQDGWAGPNATQDYYDLSNVDGFNLPMAIYPQGGTGKCYAPVCKPDLLPNCPADLRVNNAAGKTVVCLSSCTKYQTDDTCCRGAHNTSATCPAPEGARYFKAACPDAYSYAYDDLSSTFVCAQPTGYRVVFCP